MFNFFRKRKKAQKIPMIILVVTLGVGLVGSFALMSIPNVAKNEKSMDPEELLQVIDNKVSEYEKKIKDDPDDKNSLLEIAELLSQRASIYNMQEKKEEAKLEYEKAVDYYQQFIENQPKNLDALYGLANAATNLENKELANEMISKALDIKESQMLNTINRYENDYKEEKSFDNLIKLSNIRFQLANIYVQHNAYVKANLEYQKCCDLYKDAIEIEPQNTDAVYRLALSAFKVGNVDLADENFKRAIELDPEDAVKYANYGVFLMSTSSELEKAINQFNKALELNPGNDLKQRLRTFIALAENQMNTNDNKENEEQNSSDNEVESETN
jgi:tetratricopeptide (TPR) repeat protein